MIGCRFCCCRCALWHCCRGGWPLGGCGGGCHCCCRCAAPCTPTLCCWLGQHWPHAVAGPFSLRIVMLKVERSGATIFSTRGAPMRSPLPSIRARTVPVAGPLACCCCCWWSPAAGSLPVQATSLRPPSPVGPPTQWTLWVTWARAAARKAVECFPPVLKGDQAHGALAVLSMLTVYMLLIMASNGCC